MFNVFMFCLLPIKHILIVLCNVAGRFFFCLTYMMFLSAVYLFPQNDNFLQTLFTKGVWLCTTYRYLSFTAKYKTKYSL